MKRRSFNHIAAWSLITTIAYSLNISAKTSNVINEHVPQVNSKKTKHRIRFTKDFFIDRISSDSWAISVGLQPLGRYANSNITIEMQVATDLHFSQIIERILLIANSETGYRAKHLFISNNLNNLLFIRFHTQQKGTHKTTGQSIEKDIYSEIKEISPWQ